MNVDFDLWNVDFNLWNVDFELINVDFNLWYVDFNVDFGLFFRPSLNNVLFYRIITTLPPHL